MANKNLQKKYHYIYKTTNLLNNKFYVGMHSTNNLDDDYLGSGTYLWRAIRKYGKENFKKEILEYCETRALVAEREKELVNEKLLKEELCMNLKPGGRGGFSREDAKKGRQATDLILQQKFGNEWRSILSQRTANKLKNDPIAMKKKIDKILATQKAIGFKHTSFKGQQHTEESKRKIGEVNSLKQKGEGNSQYGSMWITNGVENKKIKKEETIPEGFTKGRI